MENQAYCDDCFTYVPREHAEARKPCPKCGNTFYEVASLKPLEDGSYVFYPQRYANMKKYFDAWEEICSIGIRTMTKETYEQYIAAGERNIAVIEKTMEEMIEMDRRSHLEPKLPDEIPMPVKLPNMYMRHGHWEDAQRIYDFCDHIELLKQTNLNFPKLKVECEENRLCAAEIEQIVASGIHSQKEIKKIVKGKHSQRAVNFILGKYAGLTREKFGSDFIVTIVPEAERFWPPSGPLRAVFSYPFSHQKHNPAYQTI